jgi:site-specific DNA recombinase
MLKDKMGTAKIAVGYARVSTEEQAKHGVSIDAQIEAIRSYCRKEDIELLQVYTDEGISGCSMDTRIGIQDVIAATDSRRVSHVVATALDRFSRDAADLHIFRKRCAKRNVKIWTLNTRTDYTTPTGKMQYAMESGMSEWYRDQVSEKTSTALRHVRDDLGRHLGRIPFGYERVTIGPNKGKIVVNDGEQSIISDLRKMAAAGDSYWGMSEWLNSRRIMPRSGKRWYPSSVRAILLRTKYDTAADGKSGELLSAAAATTADDAGGTGADGGSGESDGCSLGNVQIVAALPRPEVGGSAGNAI